MLVEFFGVPRQRAGVGEMEIEADTLGQMLGILAAELPAFREFIASGRLHSAFSANLNGDCFVNDPQTRLSKSDRILILSADVGG